MFDINSVDLSTQGSCNKFLATIATDIETIHDDFFSQKNFGEPTGLELLINKINDAAMPMTEAERTSFMEGIFNKIVMPKFNSLCITQSADNQRAINSQGVIRFLSIICKKDSPELTTMGLSAALNAIKALPSCDQLPVLLHKSKTSKNSASIFGQMLYFMQQMNLCDEKKITILNDFSDSFLRPEVIDPTQDNTAFFDALNIDFSIVELLMQHSHSFRSFVFIDLPPSTTATGTTVQNNYFELHILPKAAAHLSKKWADIINDSYQYKPELALRIISSLFAFDLKLSSEKERNDYAVVALQFFNQFQDITLFTIATDSFFSKKENIRIIAEMLIDGYNSSAYAIKYILNDRITITDLIEYTKFLHSINNQSSFTYIKEKLTESRDKFLYSLKIRHHA